MIAILFLPALSIVFMVVTITYEFFELKKIKNKKQ